MRGLSFDEDETKREPSADDEFVYQLLVAGLDGHSLSHTVSHTKGDSLLSML